MLACPRCRSRYPDGTISCAADGEPLVAEETVPPLESELAPGTLVGEYRIEGKLGEGGFGAVYRAVHPVIGKAAAIKVLGWDFSSNPEMVSRFVAEARAVNQIHHKNIIDVFAFGRLPDGRQYYVMELLEGKSLDDYRKERGCLSIEEALPILRGVVRALGAAHAGGIAHRDLKPENVFLVFDEDGVVMPKLIDFGIAKLLGDEGAAGHKTRTGTPMGTPYYMSPEQCRGKNVDHRTDIYSLGVLIHVLLSGKKPFDGESVMDILLKHIMEAPPRLSALVPSVPKALDDAVVSLLEKDPDKRPQSAADALAALEAAVRGAPPEVLRSRGGADPGRVSIVSGVGANQSSPEAAEAHTIVDPVRSEIGDARAERPSVGPERPSVGAANGTLEPAATDTGAQGAGGAAPPRRRLWIPVVAIAAAGAGAAVVLLMLGGKPAAGNTEVHVTAPPKDTASAQPEPVVVPGTAATPAATFTAAPTATTAAGAAPSGSATGPSGKASTSKPVGAGTAAPKTTTTAATTTKPAPHKGDATDLAY